MSYRKRKQKTFNIQQREIQFYRALSLVAIVIMVTAAYMTYGYQKREILISPEPEKENVSAKSQHMEVTGDLSLIPSDRDVEKILNKTMPDACKDCDDDPLDCLDKYTLNKVLMTGEQGESILSAEILTGKIQKKYFVMIDLSHNNNIVKKGGEIDTKQCLEEEDEEEAATTSDLYIDNGDDPNKSGYVIVE